jgi:broad specificity phosphatase PhoE
MVKTIHLIRHGHHALLGKVLCGRTPEVQLDDTGRRQMLSCASRISPSPSSIQSSPQRRALQSAAILAEAFGLAVEIAVEMDEIDLGDWTMRSLSELEHQSAWRSWNEERGSSEPPNGESMQRLQQRVVRYLESLRERQLGHTVVLVTHAEPIRAALMHYAGIPLDQFLTVEVSPASVSTLSVERDAIRVSQINQQVPA